ncbi:proton-dependent oligopeptide transporter, POT family [Sporothrix schenckii 1099-18]|uniref:Proton-dependent oligopeptide transporter, POT family n=1 Tax=Sporothrix schenckii 1099-18 TaxID=1397361 RepID=A0A0F2MEJ8_SPOSC|nr:proton-dependent oligopeptide transporter, POT family [Sporothrix schenckii 1099-18]KJR88052.1 proton-dependent oligopeptide transporter, POT family [Sporothrix schenckii 1099-18]
MSENIPSGDTAAELQPSIAASKTSNIITDNGEPVDTLGPYPTEEELKTLRRISDKIPLSIYTMTAVEFCERFSYYGVMVVVTNFVQWPMPAGSLTGAAPHGQPGAMGFGQRAATAITTFNVFWQYFMPLFGAYVADTYLGRFRTVALALGIDIIGHCILLVAGLPPLLKQTPATGSLAALLLGMLIIGVGTGGFKPNINPLVVEQAVSSHMFVRVLPKTGERVIVDPAVTSSRVFHYFYMFINIGALFGQVGMVYAEKHVGFWLSFMLPTCMLCLCPPIVLLGRKRYVRVPPQGSVLSKALRLFVRANHGRWSVNPVRTYQNLNDGSFWERVKPSQIAAADGPSWMTFDDAWVDEVARGAKACAVFAWMPFFWLCYNQMTSNLISQAAVMRLDGVPNDALLAIEPVSLVVLILLLNEAVYPLLRRLRIHFTPIKKIAVGYAVASAAMAYATVLQYFIYRESECGRYASGKLPSGERCANVNISVWAQGGAYALSLAEILISTTCLEYAQSKAPKNMRSMVQAVSLSMNAISTALGFAFVALSSDPNLVWNYGATAVLAAVAGTGFWFTFRGLDQEEDHLNMLPNEVLNGVSQAETQQQANEKVNAAA